MDNAIQVSHLKLGDFSLDLNRGVLLRGDEIIPLRPKSYLVLLHLAKNPQRLVSKQELMDKVWTNVVVTDDSLTQCITDIRKALSDHSKTLIRTVPRRGFILDLPVEAGDAGVSGKRWRLRTAPVITMLFVITTIVWVLTPRGSQTPPEDLVLISVLALESDSKNLRLGARLLAESLRLRLDEIPGVSLRSFESDMFAEPAAMLERAEEMQIDWVLTGSIDTVFGSKNDKVTLELWDVDRRSAHSLGIFSIPIGADVSSTREFVMQRDLIVTRALTRLPGHMVDSSKTHKFPSRLSDFEIYAKTMVALEKERCNPTLAPAMKPVVSRTPDFMRGWMAIAWSHWVDFWACGLGDESLEHAIVASDRVLELEPNYPQAIKVKTSALAAQGNVTTARTVAKSATRESPERAANWATLSYLLNYSGEIDESLKAIEYALELDPLVLIAETGETPNVFLYANEWDRYLQHQPPFDAPFFNFQRAYAHYRLGNLDDSLRIIEATIKHTPSDLYARFAAALKALIENEPEKARQTLLVISRQREQANQTDGETTYRQATMLRLAGANKLAVDNLWTAYHQNFVCPECVRRDPIWKGLLDDTELIRWLEVAESASP